MNTDLNDTISGLNIRLHKACQNADCVQVFQLLESGAQPNSVIGMTGTTPLMAAVGGSSRDAAWLNKGDVGIMEMLIRQGAAVHATNSHGDTALHIAVSLAAIRAVDLLLQAGSDPGILNNNDLSAARMINNMLRAITPNCVISHHRPAVEIMAFLLVQHGLYPLEDGLTEIASLPKVAALLQQRALQNAVTGTAGADAKTVFKM